MSVSAYGVVAALFAALLPIAFAPAADTLTFTPKYAVLVLAGAIGVVPLIRLARFSSVRIGARFAIGFLAAALLAALLSRAPNLGFFGLDSWGTGWLFWLGCAGSFAIGASLKKTDRPWVVGGLLFGAGVNAAIGIYQGIALPASGTFYPYLGKQADALLGNPVHLEALLLGCLALIARSAVEVPRRWWPMVLLLSVGLEFTLERVAVVVLVVLLAVTAVTQGTKRTLPFAGLTIGGYLIGYFSQGSALAARVAGGTAETTWGLRIHIWESAVATVVRHPLLGVGPGQTIAATAPRMTEVLARDIGPGTLPVDSHDFLVEVLVTTGLVGFILFVGWLLAAGSRAAGPFLGCSMAILAVELVEPLNVGITPLAFLALGVATVGMTSRSRRRQRPGILRRSASSNAPPLEEESQAAHVSGRPSRPAAIVTTVVAAAALFVGGTMVWGDVLVLKARNDATPSGKLAYSIDATRLEPYWPEPYQDVAGAYQYESIVVHRPGLLAKARPWVDDAMRADPHDPLVRADVGDLDLLLGEDTLAVDQYLQTLRLDPWTADAFSGLAQVATARHQWRSALHYLELEKGVSPVSAPLQLSILRAERKVRG